VTRGLTIIKADNMNRKNFFSSILKSRKWVYILLFSTGVVMTLLFALVFKMSYRDSLIELVIGLFTLPVIGEFLLYINKNTTDTK
jgi:hypothetical protein